MNQLTVLSQLSRTALLYLLAVLVSSIAIMYQFTPVWISVVGLSCAVWRLFIFTGKLSFPPNWLKMLLVLFSMAGAFFQYRYSLSVDMFVSILLLGFSLRLLEVYHKPSAQMLLYLATFVLMTYLLYGQTLLSAMLALMQMVLIIAALIAINTDIHLLSTFYLQPLKKSAFILAIAFPIMVVIFLMAPRVTPLWVMPLQTQQAKTGMSEQMSPGDITKLANSSDLAFRATFSGKIPPKNKLYWQGFIFDEFDGRQWKNNCECNYTWVNTNRVSLPVSAQKSIWNYQIILEPHGNRWLFALPNTYIQDGRVSTNNDNLFRTRNEIVDRMAYDGMVFDQPNKKPLTTVELRRYTQLPKQGNPKAHELANSWRAQYANDNDIVQQALQLYRTSMNYTLTPPALGADSIDDFLFVTKSGFCEHFASSFVFLMRAAGIPARVILGYQGGEINEEDGYVIVRQYDAHAWAQVWLPEQGWVSIDPTSSVDPQRIETGFESTFSDSPVLNSYFNLKKYKNINLINLLRTKLDYMDYAWSRWVLGYNASMQNSMLDRLGLNSPLRIVIWIFTISASFFIMLIVFLWRRDRQQQYEHPLTYRYRQLMMAYTYFGVDRQLSDTPLKFAQYVKAHQLPYADIFFKMSQQYNDWFCSDQSNIALERALKYQCIYWQIRLWIIALISLNHRK